MMPIPANPTNASIQPQSLYDAWADLAWRAMLTEVNLSPKPGLVDRPNCGAHKDMALADFHRSAEAIRHWLPRFMEYGRQLHAPAARVSSGGPASIGDGL